MCEQHNAEKVVPTEEDLIQSNLNGFGDEIGKITNRITSMFDVQSQYEPDSREYKELAYRILAGQLYQQDAIDKIKGIVSTPMPKYWYDKRAVYDTFGNGDQEELEFQLRIVADRKPYFMRYVYGSIDLDCKRYEKSCEEYCGMAFRKKLGEMLDSDGSDLTEEEKNAVYYYNARHPLSNNNCVMNRLCHKIESDISEKKRDFLTTDGFDYTILKSGVKYNQAYLKRMEEVEQEYANASQRLVVENAEKTNGESRATSENRSNRIDELYERSLFSIVSSDEEACDMLLDLCYSKAGTKRICWNLFGDAIVENLIQKNAYCLEYPARCTNGEFSFRGNEYRMVRKEEYCD